MSDDNLLIRTPRDHLLEQAQRAREWADKTTDRRTRRMLLQFAAELEAAVEEAIAPATVLSPVSQVEVQSDNERRGQAGQARRGPGRTPGPPFR